MPWPPLPNRLVPFAATPIKLPCTKFPPEVRISTPSPVLPEMMFRSSATVHPTCWPVELVMNRPAKPLAAANVPLTSVPMKFPETTLQYPSEEEPLNSATPLPLKRLIARPCIKLKPFALRPCTLAPALTPLSSMRITALSVASCVFTLASGCE